MRKRFPHIVLWGAPAILTIIVATPFPDIVPFMSKPPDLEALARRYVELWQDQIAATAVDPELTDGLTRMMQLMSSGMAAQAGLWQALWPDMVARATAQAAAAAAAASAPAGDQAAGRTASQPEAPPPGPAPAAGAPPDGGHDVAQLQARLAVLEERLASLEGGPGAPRRGTRPGPRRRRAS
jgi:hypothetical protein